MSKTPLKLKISIEGDYVSKIYIAQMIQTALGRLKRFEHIRIFDEYVGQTEPSDLAEFVIIKQSLPSESKDEWISKKDVLEILQYMCGCSDFPERKENQGLYYWRSIMREKFEEIGISFRNEDYVKHMHTPVPPPKQ